MSGVGILPSTSRPKGTAAECLGDFFERHENAVEVVAKYAQCSPLTAKRWTKEFKAQGHALCRVICLLIAAGYSVTEYEALNANYKKLILIVGLGIVSPVGLYERLGYKSPKRPSDVQSLWRVIFGRGQFGGKEELDAIIAEFGLQADEKLSDWARKLADPSGVRRATPPPREEVVHTTLDPGLPNSFAHLASSLVSLGLVIERQGGKGAGPAVRAATKDGAGLRELRSLIDRLLEE